MSQSPAASYTRLAFDFWALSMEASYVMWLRGVRLMSGGRIATREVERMFAEKFAAGITLWPAIASGGIDQTAEQVGARTLRHYKKPVRANRRRLSR